ncbi:hypothetical protein BgiMline_013502, partial [Biomphalaria glabrata]
RSSSPPLSKHNGVFEKFKPASLMQVDEIVLSLSAKKTFSFHASLDTVAIKASPKHQDAHKDINAAGDEIQGAFIKVHTKDSCRY